MAINLIKLRKVFYSMSGLLVLASIVIVIIFGLNLGIDFTGGGLLEIEYQDQAPDIETIRQALNKLELSSFTLQKAGDQGIVLRMQDASEQAHQLILAELKEIGQIKEGGESFQSIGPVIGQELARKTKIVIIIALLAVLAYIALSFRKVARPVKSYIYGLTSLVALFHDVLITLGVFALLGRLYGVEITIPIITALLTVFGYSINDSVVVFDRLRENLVKLKSSDFEETVGKSLKQSLTRSINTSFTTMVALFAIFFFGGMSLKFFALALIIGIGLGTYSSLFLAAPLLLTYLRFKERKYRSDRGVE